MSPGRKEEIAIRLVVCGVCGTLILSQFPAPLSHVFIAVANYFMVVLGHEDAMHVNFGWLLNKASGLQPKHQQNAIMTGLLVGGASVLPGGWVWSSLLSGITGYYTPEVIKWGS